jgi:hypothetical protein
MCCLNMRASTSLRPVSLARASTQPRPVHDRPTQRGFQQRITPPPDRPAGFRLRLAGPPACGREGELATNGSVTGEAALRGVSIALAVA